MKTYIFLALLSLTSFAGCAITEKAVDSVVVIDTQSDLKNHSCERLGDVRANNINDIKRGSDGITGSTVEKMQYQTAEKGGNVLVKKSLTQGQAFYCVSADYQQLRAMASEQY